MGLPPLRLYRCSPCYVYQYIIFKKTRTTMRAPRPLPELCIRIDWSRRPSFDCPIDPLVWIDLPGPFPFLRRPSFLFNTVYRNSPSHSIAGHGDHGAYPSSSAMSYFEWAVALGAWATNPAAPAPLPPGAPRGPLPKAPLKQKFVALWEGIFSASGDAQGGGPCGGPGDAASGLAAGTRPSSYYSGSSGGDVPSPAFHPTAAWDELLLLKVNALCLESLLAARSDEALASNAPALSAAIDACAAYIESDDSVRWLTLISLTLCMRQASILFHHDVYRLACMCAGGRRACPACRPLASLFTPAPLVALRPANPLPHPPPPLHRRCGASGTRSRRWPSYSR